MTVLVTCFYDIDVLVGEDKLAYVLALELVRVQNVGFSFGLK
jgi:hypothetical protein